MRRPACFLLSALLAVPSVLFWAPPKIVNAVTVSRYPLPVSLRRQLRVSRVQVRAAGLRVTRTHASSSASYVVRVPARVSDPEPAALPMRQESLSSSSRSSAPNSVKRPFTRIFPSVHATAVQEEVLRLVNRERSNAGLPPLVFHALLQQSAQQYAEYMADEGFFSHRDPSGDASLDRIRATGYLDPPCDCSWTYLTGENLGHGQDSPAEVMEGWMNSPGHRANILNPGFTEIGVGVFDGYWVQNFGTVRETE